MPLLMTGSLLQIARARPCTTLSGDFSRKLGAEETDTATPLVIGTTASTAAPANTLAVDFASVPTVGNALIAAICYRTSANTPTAEPSTRTLTDNHSNTWVEGAHDFNLVERRRVTTTADLDAAAVHDVLLSIYRPMRSQPVEAMRVTFSLDLLLFRPHHTGETPNGVTEPRP